MGALFGGSGATGRNPEAPQILGEGHDPLSVECRRVFAAQAALSARQLRCAHLPRILFGEQAWDILLQLYVSDASGLSLSVSELQVEQQPASTTARWLNVLEEQDLIRRKSISTAAEVVILTKKGYAALNAYLDAVQIL